MEQPKKQQGAKILSLMGRDQEFCPIEERMKSAMRYAADEQDCLEDENVYLYNMMNHLQYAIWNWQTYCMGQIDVDDLSGIEEDEEEDELEILEKKDGQGQTPNT